MDNVPDEILDAILGELAECFPIDYDHDGHFFPIHRNNVLSASSTVSRRWRTCTLPHLFRSMQFLATLDPDEQPAEARDGLLRSQHGGKTMRMLLDFLQAHPDISSCVQVLAIQPARDPGSWKDIFPDADLNTDFSAEHLLAVRALLPSLHVLTLVNVKITTPPTNMLRTSVHTLYLGRIRTFEDQEICSPLVLFSAVRQLHVVISNVGGFDNRPLVYTIPIDAMSHLAVDSLILPFDGRLQPFTDAITRSPTLHTLKSLTLGNVDPWWPDPIDTLQSFLEPLSPILESLTFGIEVEDEYALSPCPCKHHPYQRLRLLFAHARRDVGPEYILLFSPLVWPKLRSLTFVISLGEYGASLVSIWGFFVQLFSAIHPHDGLHSITLLLKDHIQHDSFVPYANNLQMLEQELLRFTAVQTVTFSSEQWSLSETQRQSLRTAMPTLHHKGILYCYPDR